MRWQQIVSVCVPHVVLTHSACIGDFSVRIKIVEIVFPHQNGYRLKIYMRAWFDAAGAAKKTARETITHFLPRECVSFAWCKMIILLHCKCSTEMNFVAGWLAAFFSEVYLLLIWLWLLSFYCGITICITFIRLHCISVLLVSYFQFCIDFHRFIIHRIAHTITRKSIFSTFKLISNSNYHMWCCACNTGSYVFFPLWRMCFVLCLWIESDKRKYELVLKLKAWEMRISVFALSYKRAHIQSHSHLFCRVGTLWDIYIYSMQYARDALNCYGKMYENKTFYISQKIEFKEPPPLSDV